MTVATTRMRVTIVAGDLARALTHAIAMRGSFDAMVVQTKAPLAEAVAAARATDALIVDLLPDASVVGVRALLAEAAFIPIVFVAAQLPLRHAVARIVSEAGQAVMPASEHPVVVHATLVALRSRQAATA